MSKCCICFWCDQEKNKNNKNNNNNNIKIVKMKNKIREEKILLANFELQAKELFQIVDHHINRGKQGSGLLDYKKVCMLILVINYYYNNYYYNHYYYYHYCYYYCYYYYYYFFFYFFFLRFQTPTK